jgi:hypothetical protein
MEKRGLSKFVAITLIVLAAAMCTAIGIGAAGNRPAQVQSMADEHLAVREAMRRGGYREAARIKGHYVGEFNTHTWLTFDLDSLAKASAAIVVGRPSRNVCRLSANGQLITTNYEVEVQEVVKGSLQQGGTITVKLPGGKVNFEDGTSAEVRTPGFRKMVNNSTYVLFLEAIENEPGSFRLVGGPQGLFAIPSEGGINPHGRTTDPVVFKNKGKDKETFLKEVRKVGKKHPQPGSCCN